MYSRLRKRLTDKRTAEEIRNNVQGLIDAGIEPQKSDLIYIKLAEKEESIKDLESSLADSTIKERYLRDEVAQYRTILEEIKSALK